MNNTKIEWADASWNPITGCTPISEACDHCYAQRMSKRLAGRCGYPADDPFRVTMHPDKLDEPLRMKKPRTIFVCSMSDFWHPEVNPCFRALVFNTVQKCPQHRFMFLTKRSTEMLEDLTQNVMMQRFTELPNVWLGVTAENQARADERIPILLQIPAAHHWVSVEPMLGHIDLTNLTDVGFDALHGVDNRRIRLELVIAGGETGPGARPMHPNWVRSLRDQCAAAGVGFHFKSWGNFLPVGQEESASGNGSMNPMDFWPIWREGNQDYYACGKKRAGRLLDGREHNCEVKE